MPVVLFAVEVEVYETAGDEDVDNGERVGDDVENCGALEILVNANKLQHLLKL